MSDPPVPDLPEPLPPDPRSIGVGRAFLGGCRAWLRHAGAFILPLALVIVPLFMVLAVGAPTMWGAMLGQVEPGGMDVPPREWFVLGGFVVLYGLGCGLAIIAVAQRADRALDALDGADAGGERAGLIERVPAVVGAWLLYVGILLGPGVPVFGLMFAAISAAGDSMRGAAAIVSVLILLFLYIPFAIYASTLLRLGPLLAAVRRRPPVAALRESVGLVRGRFWRAFGFILLASLPSQALAGVLPLAALAGMIHPVVGAAVYGAAAAVTTSFVMVQEVAILRCLEAARARDRGRAADDALAPQPA